MGSCSAPQQSLNNSEANVSAFLTQRRMEDEEGEEGEENEEEMEEMEEVEEEDVPPPRATLTRARPVNTGSKKKRKIVHRTSSGRRKDAETKTVPLRKMNEAASLDLSDPSQLTMKEIIRRAEAIARAKAREEVAKKAEEKGKRRSSSTTSASATERPAAQDTPAPSVLTPQVQIVDGRIVINQQSLVVAAQASTRENTENYRRVEEDRPKLNYHSYSNRTFVERWRPEDTELFYKALQQFGTDFELIQNLFPGRTRRQVKAKFKNEEKLNPVRLADALGHKAQDQSHHYRAIIEILKTEKAESENEDDILLENLLLPAVTNESGTPEKTPETQAGSSADKVHAVVNLEASDNAELLEKVKPDLRIASASEAVASIPPESEVTTNDGDEDTPGTALLVTYQRKSNGPVTPTNPANPLGSYGKPSNPLGQYGKNPLGVYK